MELSKLPLPEFTDALAGKTPVPGGGGASALCASLGAALASMVANYTVGKEKYAAVEAEIDRLTKTGLPGSEALNAMLTARDTTPVEDGCRLIDLLRRPQVSYADLRPFDPTAPELPKAVTEQVEITSSTVPCCTIYAPRQASQ